MISQCKLGIIDLSQSANLPHTGDYWSCHILLKACKNTERVLDLLKGLYPKKEENLPCLV